MGFDESLTVDMTSYVAVNRFSGIQRVVREVCSQSEVRGIRFILGRWRESAAEAPEWVFSSSSQSLKYSRRWLLGVWPLARRWMRRLTPWLLPAGTALARQIYSFSISSVRVRGQALEGEVRLGSLDESRAIREVSDLWLLDIPKDKAHIEALLAAVQTRGLRLHIYFYDMIPLDQEELLGVSTLKRDRALFVRYLELVQLARSIVYLSHYSESRHRQFLLANNWTLPESRSVLYPPVSLPDCSSADTMPRGLRESSDSTRHILTLGSFTVRKNLICVFHAAQILLSAGACVRFTTVVSPSGDVDEEASALARRLEREFPEQFTLLGPVSDCELMRLYKTASCVAVPSRLEGFGLPIIEAAIAGVSVVASDIEPFKELSKFVDLTLIEPGRADLWAEAFENLDLLSGASPVSVGAFPKAEDFVAKLQAIQRTP